MNEFDVLMGDGLRTSIRSNDRENPESKSDDCDFVELFFDFVSSSESVSI